MKPLYVIEIPIGYEQPSEEEGRVIVRVAPNIVRVHLVQ